MVFAIKRAFRSYNGRHFLSRWARNMLEQSSIHQHTGYILASGLLAASLLEPALTSVSAQNTIIHTPETAIPSAQEMQITTETTLAWPVHHPLITQGFRYGHTGIDVQDGVSLDIHPIDEGVVATVAYWNYGYGHHVIIEHPNGRSSLYAHFNSISVQVGQAVSRDTVLGQMGRTGYASGVHLHLEIYQDGIRLDPLAVLPENEFLAWRPYNPQAHDAAVVTEEAAIVTATVSSE